jgi:hypothetical protein
MTPVAAVGHIAQVAAFEPAGHPARSPDPAAETDITDGEPLGIG